MPMFDPKKAKERVKDDGVPPGDYLLAIKNLKRNISKTHKPYARCCFQIIAGAGKGRTFFDNVSLDVENSGAAFRLSMMCEQMGVEEAFDLDDEDSLKTNLLGRPFKARVSRKVEGEYTNNGIERYLTGDNVTQRDHDLMQEWVAARADEKEWSGKSDDVPPPGDDDFAGGYRGTKPDVDDDIPF